MFWGFLGELLSVQNFADKTNRQTEEHPHYAVERTNLPLYVELVVWIVPDVEPELHVHNHSADILTRGYDSASDKTLADKKKLCKTLVDSVQNGEAKSARNHHWQVCFASPEDFNYSVSGSAEHHQSAVLLYSINITQTITALSIAAKRWFIPL